jgi:hypothetical protein
VQVGFGEHAAARAACRLSRNGENADGRGEASVLIAVPQGFIASGDVSAADFGAITTEKSPFP